MYSNNSYIDISKLKIVDRNANHIPQFNEHLGSLFRFPLEDNDFLTRIKGNDFVWDMANYSGFSQFALENTKLIEIEPPTEDIDWNFIDEERHRLKSQIKTLLGTEANSDFLKPIISFTLDCFDNWLTYDAMHPNSLNNPWFSTNKILLNKGYLFLATDNEAMVKEYLGDKLSKDTDEENHNKLVFITSSNPKNKSKNTFKGAIVSNFCDIELKIFNYLQAEAMGMGNAKKAKDIQEFLLKKYRIDKTDTQIRNYMKYLKRDGYIGSGFNGYFFIASENDLIHTYQHHQLQLQGLQRTMKIYENRAKAMGIDDIAASVKFV